MVQVIKKDGTLEDFNVQKVVDAVNKSANRVLIKFTEEEERFICQFVEERAQYRGGGAGESEPHRRQELSGLPELQTGFCPDAG